MGCLIEDCSRALTRRGVPIIVPRCMHTRRYGRASPEYFGKDFEDAGAGEYNNWHASSVPFSRKYSAGALRERILDSARRVGLEPMLCKLANKADFGDEVCCHFVLVLNKPVAENN